MIYPHERDREVNRPQQALIFDAWVQSTGLAESLTSFDRRHSFIMGLDSTAFAELAITTNRTLRNLSPEADIIAKEVHGIPDRARKTTADVMPAPEDKLSLLDDVLETAKGLDDPADQATIIGFGINMVHPFDDGNGRTARALYGLLHQDYSPGNEQFLASLDNDGDQIYLLDGNLFTQGVYDILAEQLGTHSLDTAGNLVPHVHVKVKDMGFFQKDTIQTTRRQFDEAQFIAMKTIFMDENLGPIVSTLLAANDKQKLIRNSTVHFSYGSAFLFDEFLTHASDDEMTQAYEIFRKVKVVYTQLFLSLLSGDGDGMFGVHNPDNPVDSAALTYLQFARKAAAHDFVNALPRLFTDK